jgi:hypothetical protein
LSFDVDGARPGTSKRQHTIGVSATALQKHAGVGSKARSIDVTSLFSLGFGDEP